jgi:hypothetical protein
MSDARDVAHAEDFSRILGRLELIFIGPVL